MDTAGPTWGSHVACEQACSHQRLVSRSRRREAAAAGLPQCVAAYGFAPAIGPQASRMYLVAPSAGADPRLLGTGESWFTFGGHGWPPGDLDRDLWWRVPGGADDHDRLARPDEQHMDAGPYRGHPDGDGHCRHRERHLLSGRVRVIGRRGGARPGAPLAGVTAPYLSPDLRRSAAFAKLSAA